MTEVPSVTRCVHWPPCILHHRIQFVTAAAEKILEEFDALPREEQQRLAGVIVERLRASDDVSSETREELARRVRHIKSGEVEVLDGEEAFRSLRAKY